MKNITKELEQVDRAASGKSRANPETIRAALQKIQAEIREPESEITDEQLIALSQHSRRLMVATWTTHLTHQYFG